MLLSQFETEAFMVKVLPEQEVIRRLRLRNVMNLPHSQRRTEIQLALMEQPGLNPDSDVLIQRIDAALTRILPRIKALTPLTDDDLAKIVGKSRSTVQAYIGGRLDETLTPEALADLEDLVQSRIPEIEALLRDIHTAKLHSIK
jgi:AraC-like DNA-binding protein